MKKQNFASFFSITSTFNKNSTSRHSFAQLFLLIAILKSSRYRRIVSRLKAIRETSKFFSLESRELTTNRSSSSLLERNVFSIFTSIVDDQIQNSIYFLSTRERLNSKQIDDIALDQQLTRRSSRFENRLDNRSRNLSR